MILNEREILHMRDVQNILRVIYDLQTASAAYTLLYLAASRIWLRERYRSDLGSKLRWGGTITLGMFGAAGALSLLDFGELFLLFHLALFDNDLRRARESISIFSPYLTEHGVGRWADRLRAAIQRGVTVRVACLPPDRQPGDLAATASELVERLRAMGVAVDWRQSMHEKVAIIDSAIVWFGSLNILSHRDTTEIMWRLYSPQLANTLRGLLWPRRPGGGNPEAAEEGNPPCPRCGGPVVLHHGRYGPYYRCSSCHRNWNPRQVA